MNHAFRLPPALAFAAILLTSALLGQVQEVAETEKPGPGPAAQEDPVDQLYSAYEAASQGASDPLAALDTRYVEELQKLMDASQKDGRLEDVLAIREEIENYAKERERDFQAIPELQNLRQIYENSGRRLRSEARTAHAQVIASYLPRFKALTETLTRQGDLKNAMRSSEIQKTLTRNLAELTSAADAADTKIATHAAAPAGTLWTLGSRADFETIHDCNVKKEGDTWVLTSPHRDKSYLQSDKAFRPPFAAVALAKTDKIEIRFSFGGDQLLIFNWSNNPQQLRIQEPQTLRPHGFQDKGYITPGQFHDLEFRILPTKIQAYADGELRGEITGDFKDLEGPVGIGPAFNSIVTLESFTVRGLAGE